MNQKSLVKHLLNDWECKLEPFKHDLLVGKYYGAPREVYDQTGEITDIEEWIKGLEWILNAWEIIEEKEIDNPEIIKAITLPVQFYRGRQWVDEVDMRIVRSFAVLIC